MRLRGRERRLIARGDALLAEESYEAAEACYREALAANPESAEALYSIGCVASHKHEVETSFEWAQRALAVDPTHAGANRLAGSAMLALGQYAEALPHLEAAQARAPSAVTKAELALCHEGLGELERAEEELREVLADDPAYVTRYAFVATYRSSPFAADVHAYLARVLQRRGNYDEARLHYHLAKRVDPTVELDPMYLEIMTRDELEDHPLEREQQDGFDALDALDLDDLGEQREDARLVLRLSMARDVASLQRDLPDQPEVHQRTLSVARFLTGAALELGHVQLAADFTVVGDCLEGHDVGELFEGTRSASWRQLFELAEHVHDGRLGEADALSAAARAAPPEAPDALLGVARRFAVIGGEKAFTVALVVAAALEPAGETYAALSAAVLGGRVWSERGDRVKAERVLADLVERAAAASQTDVLLEALDALGTVQAERGGWDETVVTQRRYVDEADRAGELARRWRSRYGLAIALGHVGEADEAHVTAIDAAALARSSPEVQSGGDLNELLAWTASLAGVELSQDDLVPLSAARQSVLELRARATELEQVGRTDEALQVLAEAAAAADTGSAKASILRERARLQLELGQHEAARSSVERAIALTPESDGEDRAEEYLELARIEEGDGRYDDAVAALERALSNAIRSGSPEVQVVVRERLSALAGEHRPGASAYHTTRARRLRSPQDGELDAAVRGRFLALADAARKAEPRGAIEQMLGELDALPLSAERLSAAVITGVAAVDNELPQLAVSPLRIAIELATSEEWRDAHAELAARTMLGTAYRQTGSFPEAVAQYRLALERAWELGEELEAAEIRGRMAIALRYMDDLDAAEAAYRSAIETFRRYDITEQVAVNRMNLASTLFLLQRSAEAVDVAVEALTELDASGQEDLAFRTLAMLAQNLPPDALPTHLAERLEEGAARSHDPLLLSWSWSWAAKRLLDDGDVTGAHNELGRVIELHHDAGDRFNEASAMLNRARVLHEDAPELAREDAERSRLLAVELGQGRLAAEAEIELLELALQVDDITELDSVFRSFEARWTHLRRNLGADRDRVALADSVAHVKELCVDRYLAHGNVVRVFEALDGTRSEGLVDLLELGRDTGRERRAQGASVDVARSSLQALDVPAVAVTLDVVLDRLVIGVLRADDETPRFVEPNTSSRDVELMLEAFRDELLVYRGRSAQTWHRALEQLLAPAAAQVGGEDFLVLVPAGDLQLLPLHAASSFATSSAVVYASSFAALELARQRQPNEKRRMSRVVTVGVGFPDEARAVSIAIGGVCLSGRGVPKEQVRQAVEGASIVHFACHGYFDEDDFRDSGLLLTVTDTPMRDDILSVRDLADWRLDADLVVLSACETGVGKAAPSDFLGLSRAILAAGARAVVATLWPVDDVATQALMLDFYAELSRQGEATGWVNAAAALAAAQRRASATRPLHDWAGFKLIGWPLLEWSREI